ncbi:MAG TPA: galactose-1-phosphate uridylyltransferase [Acidimicrobiales bacterium]|nr:galactose-1-phosphate uridylyltransferase [Acidimicrobiales bacterium]
MSQLRLNPLTGRWVAVAEGREHRPGDLVSGHLPVESDPDRPCPFCPGHEEAMPPALETYGRHGEWVVRVVPNRYPAFDGDEPLKVHNLGPVFTQAAASGIHEVLVFTPDHDTTWADLDDAQAAVTMAAIRDRMEDHARRPTIRYTQVIVNSGRLAGASLEHPHGQLLGIPFVPGEIAEEEAGFRRFEGSCLLCTTLEAEEAAGHRVVYADDRVVVVCPFWSGAPYEMLVLPRSHEVHVTDAAPPDVAAVGRALRTGLARLRATLGDVAYNLVFHTAPHRHAGPFHWHVHVLPKVTSVAGFEQGTGVLIDIVAPEVAARDLAVRADAPAATG